MSSGSSPMSIGKVSSCEPGHYPDHPGINGSYNVFTNSQPAMRLGDTYATPCMLSGDPHPHYHSVNATEGSSTVYVNNLPKVRIGDTASCGMKVGTGSNDTFVGGSPTDTPIPYYPDI